MCVCTHLCVHVCTRVHGHATFAGTPAYLHSHTYLGTLLYFSALAWSKYPWMQGREPNMSQARFGVSMGVHAAMHTCGDYPEEHCQCARTHTHTHTHAHTHARTGALQLNMNGLETTVELP